MSLQIKNKQYWLFFGLIGTLSISLCIAIGYIINYKKILTNISQPKKQLTTGVSRVNQQEMWVHDFTTKAEVTQKRLDTMQQTLDQLLQINSKVSAIKSNDQDTSVANLKNDLVNIKQSQSMSVMNELPPNPTYSTPIANFTAVQNKFRSRELKKISLNLGKDLNAKALKTTDNTIPSGTFAGAILLGGVDASTSIQASSDPRPILLRLTDPGTLPRRFKSDLEGCHALAASYGDLSSERVFMRLEKLSCVERRTGEVIDISIQGYVAGEDGRAGIRGVVVDRAGESMRNVMVGGFFSSIGKFLGQARSPILFSPATGLAQNNSLAPDELLKQSAANGVGGALDKYADFYIKRAEQMQPVIQVAAGRHVDLVFTHGLDFADSKLRQTLSKTRDQKRYQQVQNISEQTIDPHSVNN